jgi:hypothetical protein
MVRDLPQLRPADARERLTGRTSDDYIERQRGIAQPQLLRQFIGAGIRYITRLAMGGFASVKVESVRARSIRIGLYRCRYLKACRMKTKRGRRSR